MPAPSTGGIGMAECPVQIASVDAFVFRAPAVPPVQTSFGIMHDRPAVLVRVRDRDGAEGWGEIWCNFPTVGAEHRARLALAYGRPLIAGKTWTHPAQAWPDMHERLQVLMLQTGEAGPLHQMMAGIDTALWDLFARRAGKPLWQYLGGDAASNAVQVYASGINPSDPEVLAAEKAREGYRAFKLKVGFGIERDVANLRRMRETLGDEATLMVDANQAWTFDQACQAGRHLLDFGLAWLEEPLRASAPPSQWQALARALPLRLAGGENVSDMARYEDFLAVPGMSVIQPDVGKWGGITGCIEVARRAISAGRWYCPHWLGAGIGLAASMHLKAAAGGAGYVEVDANPNPLRDLLAQPALQVEDGYVRLGQAPGLGVVPDLDAAKEFGVSAVALP